MSYIVYTNASVNKLELGFLFRFACERLPGILTVFVVCGSVVLHD